MHGRAVDRARTSQKAARMKGSRAAASTLAIVLLVAFACVTTARAEFRLIPEPQRLTPGAGRLSLRSNVTIAVSSADAEDHFAAQGLGDEIEAACGTRPRVVDGPDGTIVLARVPGERSLGDEGYRIEVKPSGARLVAATAAGLFYATQTLRQMIEPDGVAAATIEDRPALRWRGVHDDVSRGPLPTVETLERRIRTAAELKFNFYVLYLETAYAYRGHPLLVTPGAALTEADVRTLVAYARRWHVELVPEQQTTSHLSGVLRFERYADLAQVPHGSTLARGPRSEAFVRSLYDELVPLFPGPFLHVAADEIAAIGDGGTEAGGKSASADAAIVQRLKDLRRVMQPYGKRLMFWGDGCVDRPGVIRAIPKDLVVASWCYESEADYSKWITPFRDAGLEVIVCPGALNWNRVFPNLDIALPNIRDFVRSGRRAGALGSLTCTWADNGDAPFDLNWYALAGGAAASWQQADLDTLRLRAAFDWVLFRNPGTEAADAIASLQSGHRIVTGVKNHDANLTLYWQNPFASLLDRQLLAALEPASSRLRASAESAIEGFARARAGARRNVEVLDAHAFAARRMRAIGLRAYAAARVPRLYQQLVDDSKASLAVADVQRRLGDINEILVEGRDTAVLLRGEHERLWRSENQPCWLGNILALYDRDIQQWLTKLDALRQVDILMRSNHTLPPASTLGFGS